jgi:tetratricopeptide (TPR) repeat protein
LAQIGPIESNKPINLDRELEDPVVENRAVSYYHYALAKWFDDKGDLTKALSEMRVALKYNKKSATVHLEMAGLLEKAGQISDALEYAREAARLDPQDPDPHWFLANFYLRPRGRGIPVAEGLGKAIEELESLKELTPEDERVYYFLGGAYFENNEPQKAIESYEKFQTLVSNTDRGYQEIARYYNRSGLPETAIEYLIKGLEIQPDSSETLWLLGNTYAKLGKHEEAIPAFRKLLKITQNRPAVGRELAESLFKAGEYEETVKLIQEFTKDGPPDRNAQILLGRSLIGLGRIPEAVETFQSLLELNSEDTEIQFYLGVAHEEGGNFKEAAKIFSDLMDNAGSGANERQANRLVFQQHLARSYMGMGEYEKAVEIYRNMVGPGSSDGQENQTLFKQQLAFAYMELGEYQDAIALYREMSGSDERLNLQLLNAYRISRQFDQAIQMGKGLYEKDPDNVQMGIIYARTLADAGNLEEGIDILSRLLESNSGDIDLHIALSQIYTQGKRYSNAEAVLRQAKEKKLDGEYSETLNFQLASVYERKKDFDRSEKLFKEVLKTSPNNAAALNYMGYMLADRGVRLKEALQYIKDALAIDPNNGAYLDSLGWAFFKLSDLKKAEQYLLQADKLVRNDPVIDDHLGDLYYKTGDFQQAHDFWAQSVKKATDPEDIQRVRSKLEKLQKKLKK